MQKIWVLTTSKRGFIVNLFQAYGPLLTTTTSLASELLWGMGRAVRRDTHRDAHVSGRAGRRGPAHETSQGPCRQLRYGVSQRV